MLAASILFIIPNNISLSQIQFPTFFNERGDTIKYTYSLPYSLYKRNELIIKFKPQTLNYNLLCYDCPISPKANKIQINFDELPAWFKTQIMSQKFYTRDLVIDTNLANALISFGGDSLRRMTSANPCKDTLSISRLGDTLKCEDFLLFVLEINNDTSAIIASMFLNYLFNNFIYGADLNYAIHFDATPYDGYFSSRQYSLSSQYGIGAETAWDYETGDYNIKIGVIDNGIDWTHCDFGGNIGPGYKISGGWNYASNSDELINGSDHGTPVAGIIGALMNRNCGADPNSVAGIAGGWLDNTIDNKGCQLIALKINLGLSQELDPNGKVGYIAPIISAIHESSTNSDNGSYRYGSVIDILNICFEIHDKDKVGGDVFYFDVYSEPLREALIYAFQNNVSIVTSKGNDGSNKPTYPNSNEPSMITSVGGSYLDKRKWTNSNYGNQMDILAPWGGAEGEYPPTWITVYTTMSTNIFRTFNGTSAAAPHVTGVYGLLRSYALHNSLYNFLEPEDYEGMIKASAKDIDATFQFPYLNGYDDYSGWGHLQVDNLFDMLVNGYTIEHYTSNQKYIPSAWGPVNDKFIFENSFLKNNQIFTKKGETDAFKVRKRSWICYKDLDDLWVVDEFDHINRYVWGRSGRDGIGGFSGSNPNYQVRFSQLTSGTGGNTFTDGIYHNNSLRVMGSTFQYEVKKEDGTLVGIFPPDNEMAINFSVFGKRKTGTLVKENKNINNFIIFPNPFDNILNLDLSKVKNQEEIYKIELVNILGNLFYSEIIDNQLHQNHLSIKTDLLHSGFYLLKILNNRNEILQTYNLVKL